jgi:hypothetical protein
VEEDGEEEKETPKVVSPQPVLVISQPPIIQQQVVN